ncbi:hypothetical protein DFH06DRAFT_1052796 [Mycena polygramma]|nr:hypothetical protein DFH06DRAFT_1052796 [Mycena polygramma]
MSGLNTMPSVEELQTRIAMLLTEIDVQKNVLKNLEREKSLAQRQLNSALDPVARLPLEVSSEIFLQSLPPFPKTGAEHVPILFLNVCHAWTDIALSKPELWAGIQITFPCTPTFKDGVQAWLHRACKRPLSISLCGPGSFEPGATDLVWQYAPQMKHLDLRYAVEDGVEDFDNYVDLLGGDPESLPLLKALTIRGYTDGSDGIAYSGPQIPNLLRLASHLVECTIDSVYLIQDCEALSEIRVLPSLRQFLCGFRGSRPDSDDAILKALSLPGLEALSIYTSLDDLLSFLTRSLPPLRELVLNVRRPEGSTRLHDCLRLVPTLTHLELWLPGFALPEELFAMLAESFSPVVPSLQSFVIADFTEAIPLSSWKTVLRTLAERRAKLRIFEIIMVRRFVQQPPADVFAAFKTLATDGMQIRIGDKDSDFL